MPPEDGNAVDRLQAQVEHMTSLRHDVTAKRLSLTSRMPLRTEMPSTDSRPRSRRLATTMVRSKMFHPLPKYSAQQEEEEDFIGGQVCFSNIGEIKTLWGKMLSIIKRFLHPNLFTNLLWPIFALIKILKKWFEIWLGFSLSYSNFKLENFDIPVSITFKVNLRLLIVHIIKIIICFVTLSL